MQIKLEDILKNIIAIANDSNYDVRQLTRAVYKNHPDHILSDSSIYSFMQKEGIPNPGFTTIKSMAADYLENHEELQVEVEILPGKTRNLKKWTEGRVKKVLTVLDELEKKIKKKKKKKAIKKIKYAETLVLGLADLHSGKEIKYKGKICYDPATMKSRLQYLFSIVDDEISSSNKINELVILMNGDMVDGENVFKNQHMCQSISEIPGQLEFLTEIIWTEIRAIEKGYPNLKIRIEAVKGNHGTGKENLVSNWDVAFYQQLRILTKMTDSNVEVNFGKEEYHDCVIKGWKYHLRHETVPEGEKPADIKKLAGWYMLHEYNAIVSGHLHNHSYFHYFGRPSIRIGCLAGSDDYSEKLAVGCPASQTLWKVTENEVVKEYTVVEV